MPFGGHKGSALSMMIELLAAALTGGNFSFEFDWSNYPGAHTPLTGQLVILIDPSKTAGQNFAQRSQELVREMRGAGLRRLPGDQRHRTRQKSLNTGIEIETKELQRLRDLAGGGC
ncbi:Ldh family oxidoreductase [Serratia marcescens]|nr:Ldh family oxidoreductase [Serratia marcescens]